MTGVLQLLNDELLLVLLLFELYSEDSIGVIAYKVGVFNWMVGVISKLRLVALNGLFWDVFDEAAFCILNIFIARFCMWLTNCTDVVNELGDEVLLVLLLLLLLLENDSEGDDCWCLRLRLLGLCRNEVDLLVDWECVVGGGGGEKEEWDAESDDGDFLANSKWLRRFSSWVAELGVTIAVVWEWWKLFRWLW